MDTITNFPFPRPKYEKVYNNVVKRLCPKEMENNESCIKLKKTSIILKNDLIDELGKLVDKESFKGDDDFSVNLRKLVNKWRLDKRMENPNDSIFDSNKKLTELGETFQKLCELEQKYNKKYESYKIGSELICQITINNSSMQVEILENWKNLKSRLKSLLSEFYGKEKVSCLEIFKKHFNNNEPIIIKKESIYFNKLSLLEYLWDYESPDTYQNCTVKSKIFDENYTVDGSKKPFNLENLLQELALNPFSIDKDDIQSISRNKFKIRIYGLDSLLRALKLLSDSNYLTLRFIKNILIYEPLPFNTLPVIVKMLTDAPDSNTEAKEMLKRILKLKKHVELLKKHHQLEKGDEDLLF